MVRRDGEERIVHSQAVVTRFVEGKARQARGFIQDITEHMRAEDALRESEAQLGEAQRLARIGSWTWNSETGTVHWSDEHYRLFGIAPVGSAVSHEDFLACIHPDDLNKVVESTDEFRVSGGHGTIEYRIVRPDGETRFMRAWSEIVLDGDTNPRQMRGVVQDITEYRLEAEAKRVAESRLIAILDNMPVLVSEKDTSGRYRYVNPELQRNHHQLNHSELVGKTVRDIKPDIATMIEENDQTVRNTRSAVQFEFTAPHPEGDRHYLSTKFPLLSARGDVESIVSMDMDITELKRAEQNSRKSEERLRLITDNLPAFVAYVDANGNYQFANNFYEDWFGRRADEIIGLSVEAVVGVENFANMRESHLRALSGESVTRSGKFKSPDQRIADVRGQYVPDQGPDGTVRGYFVLSQDITEMKRVEEELRKSEGRLNMAQRVGHVGSWDVDVESGKQQWSDECFRILGFEIGAKAPSFEKFMERIHPDDRAGFMKARGRALYEDQPFDQEYRFILPGGELRHLNSVGEATLNASGSPARMIGTVQDITERKRAEQALSESEARFRSIFEGAAFGITITSLDDRVRLCNPAYSTMLGYGPGDLDGVTWSAHTHPGDKSENQILSDQLYRGEIESFQFEKRYLRKDGEVLWASLTVNLVGDGVEIPRFEVALIEDISERKAAEDALSRSRAMLEHAEEMAHLGSWEADYEEDSVIWSDEIFRIIGVAPSEFDGRRTTFLRYVHPEDRERIAHHFEGLRMGQDMEYTCRVLRPDGEERMVYVHGMVTDVIDGVARQARGTLQDITESKRAQDALRDSEADLARAQEISHLGSWTWDVEADQVHWSAEHYRIFGLDPGGPALTYAAFISMLHEDDRESVMAGIEEALRSESTFDREYRLVRPDGQIRLARSIGQVELGKNGKPRRVTGTVQDITERSQVEEQLRQAQKMEAIGRLAGGIAHDFNNLLAVILGNLELIGERVNGDDAVTSMVERGLTASERGAALTHRLLAFSRKQTLRPATIDLNEQVSNMTDMLTRTLSETIEIRTRGALNLWPCYTDQSQLENALLNLSINARDAMPDGGTLTIETVNISLGEESAAAEADVEPGDYVVLVISDTGTGIEPESLEHVFEPFFTTKEVGKGTGLGLSMVYGFAKQSSGTATISSEPGEGTTVKLYLPRAKEAADAQNARLATARTPTSKGEKILVVEDDAEVRALAVRLLTRFGYEIAEAGSAEAALETMKHAAPIDLLLTDVVLPGAMNGPELVAEIRRQSPATKQLYMTGYAEQALNDQHGLDGKTRVLHKPFRMAELANTVRSVLDER